MQKHVGRRRAVALASLPALPTRSTACCACGASPNDGVVRWCATAPPLFKVPVPPVLIVELFMLLETGPIHHTLRARRWTATAARAPRCLDGRSHCRCRRRGNGCRCLSWRPRGLAPFRRRRSGGRRPCSSTLQSLGHWHCRRHSQDRWSGGRGRDCLRRHCPTVASWAGGTRRCRSHQARREARRHARGEQAWRCGAGGWP
mmetsp:Transcript_17931/g.36980  ORF Transcript_17931/g.36980 Transcript_17931/m.36980 type:complete len:202 (-) Transcript_17931:224-829(-)